MEIVKIFLREIIIRDFKLQCVPNIKYQDKEEFAEYPSKYIELSIT